MSTPGNLTVSMSLTMNATPFVEVLQKVEAAWKKGMGDLKNVVRITAAEIGESWAVLGARPQAAITKEIEKVEKALDTLKLSGRVAMGDIARATEAADAKIAKLEKELSVANEESKDFGIIGVRSIREVETEISSLENAYLRLSASKKVSQVDLARSFEAMAAQVKTLRAEMVAPLPTTKAFTALGMRPEAEIKAEIHAVETAYRTLAASGVASQMELTRATEAARVKTAALHQELTGVKDTTLGWGKAIKSMAGMMAAFGVMRFGKSIVHTELEFQKAQNTMSMLTGSARQGAEEFGWVARMADRAGVSIEEGAKAYGRWIAASRVAGLSGAESRKIFEQLATGFARVGSTTIETTRAFHALAEILDEGKVTPKRMTQLSADSSPALYALKRAMEEVGKESVKLIPRMAELFAQEPAGGVEKSKIVFNQLENAYKQAQDTIAQGGLMAALEEAAAKMTAFLNKDETHAALEVFGEFAGGVVRHLAGLDTPMDTLKGKLDEIASSSDGAAMKMMNRIAALMKFISFDVVPSLESVERVIKSTWNIFFPDHAAIDKEKNERYQNHINDTIESLQAKGGDMHLERRPQEIQKLAESGKISWKEAYQAVREYEEAALTALAQIGKKKEELEKLSEQMDEAETKEHKKAIDEKIKHENEFVAASEKALQESLTAYQKYTQAVDHWQNERELLRGTKNDKIRAIRQRGMNPIEKDHSDRMAYREKLDESMAIQQKARIQKTMGHEDLPKSEIDRAISLAKEAETIAAGLKFAPAAIQGVTEAAKVLDLIYQHLEERARENQAAQKESIDALRDGIEMGRKSLGKLQEELKGLSEEETYVEIKGNFDEVEASIKRIKEGLSGLRLPSERDPYTNPSPTPTPPQGYASGGSVPGYGHEDTVHALLTPGEFVLTPKAVERAGLPYLNRLNSGEGPAHSRFARGGVVAGIELPAFAGGGVVGASDSDGSLSTGGRWQNTIRIEINDPIHGTIGLHAAEADGRRFANVMRRLSKGTAQ
ncbi:MAG: hypothetical protein HQL66_03270 [Magnetococcales bacterium]|nr:hypothetical protein [Magnetococcales bacterium]